MFLEYGHVVAMANGFDRTSSEAVGHTPGENLRANSYSYSPAHALQLAFNEGWGNFFSVVAQESVPVAPLETFRIGDRSWEQYNAEKNFPDSNYGAGEDEENTNMRILWDLYDPANEPFDRVEMAAKDLFDTIRLNHVRTLDQLWDTLNNPFAAQKQFDYGAIFQAQNVSPRPVGIWENGAARNSWPQGYVTPPTFVWEIPQGGGVGLRGGYVAPGNLLDTFTIRFWDANNNFLFETIALSLSDLLDLGQHRVGYTLSAVMWSSLSATPGVKRWTVCGGWSAGGSGLYSSDARDFEITN